MFWLPVDNWHTDRRPRYGDRYVWELPANQTLRQPLGESVGVGMWRYQPAIWTLSGWTRSTSTVCSQHILSTSCNIVITSLINQPIIPITIISQNSSLFMEKIRNRLNSGDVFYYSVKNISSSRLLSENLSINIHKNIILPVVRHVCATWSLTLI